jgi:hypothetical protein
VLLTYIDWDFDKEIMNEDFIYRPKDIVRYNHLVRH